MSLGFSRRDARFCGMGQQPGVILLVLLMFFSAIGMRLVWMQLLHGAENRVAADENRIRLMPRSPIRGRLLDRKGRVLASSKLTYTLFIEPRLVTDEQWPALRDRLAGLMQLDPKGLDQARERGMGKDGYRIPLVNGLQPEQVLRCLLYTSPSPRDRTRSRMPSSA